MMKSKFIGVHKKGSGALTEIEHLIEGEVNPRPMFSSVFVFV